MHRNTKFMKLSYCLIVLFYCLNILHNVKSDQDNTYKQNIASKENPVIVDTPVGRIQGQLEKGKSFLGNDYLSFHGIPYAMAPVGDLRFEEPRKLQPFKDTFIASSPTKCLQFVHSNDEENLTPEGDEDCLHLNIYVPGTSISKQNNDKKPVLVFIHGGAFMFGNGYECRETYLMDTNLILVTINYRVGVFGFLSSGDTTLPGNNGMKDQVMALKWVQTNIASFGGDPDSVTLSGLSAGGASVHFHMLSPLSKGLFHKAISFSGVALNPWTIQDDPMVKFLKLSKNLECYDHEKEYTQVLAESAKSCLKSRDAKDILVESKVFRKWYYNPFSPFAPVVDSWATKNKGFMPEHPVKVMNARKIVNDVPWITSMTTSEGLYPGGDYVKDDFKLFKELEEKWDDVIHHILHTEEVTIPMGLELINSNIRKKYFEMRDSIMPEVAGLPTSYRKLTVDDYKTLIELLGDRLFLADYDTALRLHTSGAIKSKVWAYRYNYSAEHVPSYSYILQGNNHRYGVSHGDDFLMIFDGLKHFFQEPKRTGDDLKMTEYLLNMVETFANTGKPGIDKWTPMETPETLIFLDIQNPDNIEMNTVKEFGNATYWKRLFFYENELYDLSVDVQSVSGIFKTIDDDNLFQLENQQDKLQKDEL